MSSEQSSVSRETIEQTKQQIRSLVGEISQLSKSDVSPEEYYAAFLQRIVQALAAVGGAIWLLGEGRRPRLTYQINLSETLLDSSSDDATRHTRLLNSAMHTGEGHLIPPLSGASEEEAGGNPTRYLLVMAPLKSDDKVEGIVEIFQRPDSPPATQRGYLRFLEQMAELASEWLKSQKLRQFSDRQSLWAQADHFSRMVHESLNLRETAYTVANEGRRLIGCDRVSVALMKGRKCVIEAVSGQDTLENRSNIVSTLGQLATRVVATGEPLWYEGSTEDYPPQIEKAVEEYVDESYTKSLVVLPLRKPKSADEAMAASGAQVERDQDRIGDVIGAMIVEQIESELPRSIITPRIDLVYEHSARAIANSADHTNLFLMPVWRSLGKATWVVRTRHLPKTLAIAGLILLVAGILTFVKKDFNLKAKGSLQPVVKQDVFVDVGGTITDVEVEDQEQVEKDQILLRLRNTDLEVQLEDVTGQMQSTREQLNAAMDARTRQEAAAVTDEAEMIRLDGQIAELSERLRSLEKQYELLKQKRDRLVIKSPIAGKVLMSWEIERSLENRSVEVGTVLMSVADLTQEWEVELYMPERRMGHIDAASQAEPREPLDVSYILATDPKTTRHGKVIDVQKITQVHDEEGNTVRLKVEIDETEIRDPRPGATVTGKVKCGRRAIGYTWFHEAVEWAQANILF